MRLQARRLVGSGAGIIALAVLLLPGVATASGGQLVSQAFRFDSSVPGFGFVGEIRHGDGTVTATWAAPGSKVRVTGSPGATVVVRRSTSKDLLTVIRPTRLSKQQTLAAVATYRAHHRSPAADAAHNAGSPAPTVPTSASSIYDSWCVDVYGDSNRAKGHVCNVESILQQNGSDWYLGDEVTGTGHDGSRGLFSFLGADFYGSGNTLVKWAPSGTVRPSACNTVTYGLTWGAASISSTATLCPDKIDPVLNAYGPGFGEFWHGSTTGYVGLNPVDVIHDPANASPTGSLHVYIHWN